MKPALKEQILRYNRNAARNRQKAEDLEVILRAVKQLPYGQLKKLLTDDVLTVLARYGIEEV